MARTTNTNTTETTATETTITTTATATVKLERANRVAVQNTATGYKADFYRTHKKLATLSSEDIGWEADASLNKSAQRESFRQYAIEHADAVGILWQPQDLRTADNVRIPKYTSDELLKADAEAMLTTDIAQLVDKCPHGAVLLALEAEAIIPMTTTAKGADLSKLGITEGKYNSTGNWAWAEVEMLVTLFKDTETIYYTTKVQLVSGQLKKPHITQTSFNESIKTSLQEAGIWQEAKAEDTTKEEPAEAVTDTTEEVTESKTEKTSKRGKKTTKTDK